MSSRRRERGFTLLEALVALALTALVLALTAGLLGEPGPALAAAGLNLGDPLTGALAARLRVDGEAAARFSGETAPLPGLWSSEALTLVRPDGTAVRYWLENGRLLRAAGPEPLEGVAGSAWLPPGAGFRWRAVSSELLEIAWSYPGAAWPGTSRRRTPVRLEESLVVALRGGGRRGGW